MELVALKVMFWSPLILLVIPIFTIGGNDSAVPANAQSKTAVVVVVVVLVVVVVVSG